MIEKKKIEQLPILPVKARKQDEYIGLVRMFKDSIVMDVYESYESSGMVCLDNEKKETEIKIRWVCDKQNFLTYLFRKHKWSSGGMQYGLHGDSQYWGLPDIRLDKKSERAVMEFLEKCGHKDCNSGNAVRRLEALENHIRYGRRDRAEERRRSRIDSRVEKRTPLPGDWEKWLRATVFKEERYLFYNAKKRKSGICAYCGKEVSLDGMQKYNGYGKCPSCGSRIQYKTTGKTVQKTDIKKAVYMQKIAGGFVIRYFNIIKTSSESGEKYQSNEVVMDTYIGEKRWRDYCYKSWIYGEMYWDDRRWLEMGSWKPAGYLYTRNIKRVLKDTVFCYAPLAEWMRHEKTELPVGDFICSYPNSPFLEFFIKIGLYRLTRDYLEYQVIWTGHTYEEILQVNKEQLNRLIHMDGGRAALEWLRYERKAGSRIKDEIIMWLQDNKIYPCGCGEILEAAGSVERMVNYMRKQSVPPAEFAATWRDYLRMAEDEGMDIGDDIVRFPKDLRLRHDQLVMSGELRKDEQRLKEYRDFDRKIEERLPEVKRYYWEDRRYVIVPAAKCEELIKEGRTLHHCVGMNSQYMQKMADGISWILFLRKKEEMDVPYYTIEIDMENDDILQYYSKFDRKPDRKEIIKVLETFQKSIQKRKRVRMSVCIPA